MKLNELEKIINGASLVQLYTGMVYKGPGIVSNICNELTDIFNSEGIKKMDEVENSFKEFDIIDAEETRALDAEMRRRDAAKDLLKEKLVLPLYFVIS